MCTYRCKVGVDGHISHSWRCSTIEHKFYYWYEDTRVTRISTAVKCDFFTSFRLKWAYIMIISRLRLEKKRKF